MRFEIEVGAALRSAFRSMIQRSAFRREVTLDMKECREWTTSTYLVHLVSDDEDAERAVRRDVNEWITGLDRK